MQAPDGTQVYHFGGQTQPEQYQVIPPAVSAQPPPSYATIPIEVTLKTAESPARSDPSRSSNKRKTAGGNGGGNNGGNSSGDNRDPNARTDESAPEKIGRLKAIYASLPDSCFPAGGRPALPF